MQLYTESKKQTQRSEITLLNAYIVKTNPTTKDISNLCRESILKLGMPQAFAKSDYSELNPRFQNKEKANFFKIVL